MWCVSMSASVNSSHFTHNFVILNFIILSEREREWGTTGQANHDDDHRMMLCVPTENPSKLFTYDWVNDLMRKIWAAVQNNNFTQQQSAFFILFQSIRWLLDIVFVVGERERKNEKLCVFASSSSGQWHVYSLLSPHSSTVFELEKS